MAQDKFPSQHRKARSKSIFLRNLKPWQMFLIASWSWKCLSMDNLLMQYWACSCKIDCCRSQCYLLKENNVEQQKKFLQNIDINHLLRGQFFLHKKQLSVPEMETSLSITLKRAWRQQVKKKSRFHFTCFRWMIFKVGWIEWSERTMKCWNWLFAVLYHEYSFEKLE